MPSAGAWSATSTTARSSGSSRSRSACGSSTASSSRIPRRAAGIARATEELAAALSELRELARGLHPAVLSDHGLEAALTGLVQRAPLPVELTYDVAERPPPAIEVAAYYVIAESLTNVAKYARASHADVEVRSLGDRLLVAIEDDGVGGADHTAGSGLVGLEDRVAALGGRLHVESAPGRGTSVRADVPVAVVTRSEVA